MAGNVGLSPHYLEAGLESPIDEEGVHDSFSQLIAEQSEDGPEFELQALARELDEEDRDYVNAYLTNPDQKPQGEVRQKPQGEVRRGRRDLDRDEEAEPLNQTAEKWSSATLRVLSSMPSRTIGRTRGAIISQYYNRTTELRMRRHSRPSIRDLHHSSRPSLRGYRVQSDSNETDGANEMKKQDNLVNNLQSLSVSDRDRMLRAMPLGVAAKSEIRRLVLCKEQISKAHGQIHCCSQLKFNVIIAARHAWYSWLSFLHSLQLWHVALKRVGGRFGTGVLSYFLFLKTLLFFNLFLFLVTGLFLVLPQAVHPPEPPPQGHLNFSGLELLTGRGYFSDSVMYYGYYSNYTLNGRSRMSGAPPNASADESASFESAPRGLSYNMPLAYFFTIGMAFFITCIILVYCMSKSFGQSFRVEKSHDMVAMKVFCSWDFKVIKKPSVALMSENISTQLKELLADVNRDHDNKTLGQKLCRLTVHCLAWSICIGSTMACALAVYYLADHMYNGRHLLAHINTMDPQLGGEASLLALPVGVSLINLLLPGLFNAAAWMEEYDSPSVRTYVAISRNLMLKMCLLGVLCYHWLGREAVESQALGQQCWESFVGQELYRFLLMDLVFTVLDTLFGEFLWRLFSEKVLKRSRRPVFDIARNVLELIYGQTLAWLGVLFSPLLPGVQIIKLLLLFYIKMGSVMLNCQAPRKPYRASQMTTIFITLLCFPAFLGASVCVTYTMWSISPSSSCGPFRGLKTMMQAGRLWVEQLERDTPSLAWLATAHAYLVENPLFLFVAAGIFLIVIYFHTQVVGGQRKIIDLLQEQIKNEGEDKKFLIMRLQSIHEKKRSPPRHSSSQDSAC
ncbi:unnamed protein product [Merluccius merluccius]